MRGSTTKDMHIEAQLLKPRKNMVVAVVVLLVAVSLWLNVTGQSKGYGSGNGRFADQIASYSEYRIRNTVLNNLIGTENVGDILISTNGYGRSDYSFYPNGTRKYYSNRGIQARAYKWIARLDQELFLKNQDRFFQAFRFINCLLLVLCAAVFFIGFFGKNLVALASVLVFSITGGAALFASNLYFAIWLMFTPLLCFPVLQRGHGKSYVGLAFVFSLLYFSVRYEFATTFALLWLFPAVALLAKTGSFHVKISVFSFLAICCGFALAVLLHHLSVVSENHISFGDASALIFERLKTRVASMDNVPKPLTLVFFKSMLDRWKLVGLSLPLLFSVTKLAWLVSFVALFFTARHSDFVYIFIWAAVAYLSWYIFGYQHIMWHAHYDTLLFAATVQLALILYVMDGVAVVLNERLAFAAREVDRL